MAFASGSRGVQIGSPDRGKGEDSRSESGRKCSSPECATILSTYNASATCWLHSEPNYRHSLYRA